MADAAWVAQWMRRAQELIEAHHAELTDLDRAIGDGDHGENMRRGFAAVIAKLPQAELVSEVLQSVAATLISTVGGAAGPLYGTAFLRASQVAQVTELTPEIVVEILKAMLQGIQSRGGAQVGEKTMVDALVPALQNAEQQLQQGATLTQLWHQVAQGAQQGAAQTIPLQATKGRASYLGERSCGHRDPGAQSMAYILAAASDVATD